MNFQQPILRDAIADAKGRGWLVNVVTLPDQDVRKYAIDMLYADRAIRLLGPNDAGVAAEITRIIMA